MTPSLSGIARNINRHAANSRIGGRLLRTLPVPADLGAVSDIDRAGEVPPESAGLTRDDVGAIWSRAEDLYCTGYYPALMLCIRRHCRVVVNRAIGLARGFGEPGGPQVPEPVTTRTPACLYSASKAVTAIVIHKLADEGRINLLDPVGHYLPEFARHGKERLNILQILSHRGGVPGIRSDLSLEELIRHETLLKLICDAEPTDVLGRRQAYHAITGGTILQAILEHVTGHTIRSYWHEHFKKPMRVRHFDYGATRKEFDRMARDRFAGARVPQPLRTYFRQFLGLDVERDRDFVNNYAFFSEPVPAGNMIATAEETSRFFQMLLDDGRYGEKQIISKLAAHRATWETSPHRLDNTLKVPLRYSAGMMLGGEPLGLFGPHTGNAFGHLGLINIFAWADPDRDIAVALLSTGKPLLAHNAFFLIQLLREINNRIPRRQRARSGPGLATSPGLSGNR